MGSLIEQMFGNDMADPAIVHTHQVERAALRIRRIIAVKQNDGLPRTGQTLNNLAVDSILDFHQLQRCEKHAADLLPHKLPASFERGLALVFGVSYTVRRAAPEQ